MFLLKNIMKYVELKKQISLVTKNLDSVSSLLEDKFSQFKTSNCYKGYSDNYGFVKMDDDVNDIISYVNANIINKIDTELNNITNLINSSNQRLKWHM